ncbi:hypothetical protein Ancab_004458 [Ancistrocladus abbreviatus]
MGNCIGHESQMQWGGEDWGSVLASEREEMKEEEEEGLLADNKLGLPKSSATTVAEVKVRITKKQLGELLGKTGVQGLPVQQVLAHLMHVSAQFEVNHIRTWRPGLQSIPEVHSFHSTG